MKIEILSLAGLTYGHMALVEPAPRRSPRHPGYNYTNIDYDIISPLGSGITFPCRGAAAGPIFKSYSAGSEISIHIEGIAKHEGGHCQFSMSYDQVDFAVLKTVMGDCIIETVDYKVLIPKDAPNGRAIFVWTWFNKMGNREMYMNCVDIEITGGSPTGSIVGKKMVVANLPGYPTFPEGFAKDYAKDLYENQPIINVAPSARPTSSESSSKTTDPVSTTLPTTSTHKPTSTSESTTTSKSSTIPTPTAPPSTCSDGQWYCNGSESLGLCWNGNIIYQPCPEGTTCQLTSDVARCL